MPFFLSVHMCMSLSERDVIIVVAECVKTDFQDHWLFLGGGETHKFLWLLTEGGLSIRW